MLKIFAVLLVLDMPSLRDSVVDCKPWGKVFDSCEPIHIAIAAKNLVKTNYRLAHLAHMFDSVLQFAAARPLHWLILIPTNEVPVVSGLLERIKAAKAQVPVTVGLN